MERVVITIPPILLTSLDMNWTIDWRGQSAPLNDGNTQTVFNKFPRWVGSPSVFLYRENIAHWRAINSEAQGAVGIYKVRMFDPAGINAANFYPGGIPFSSGALFSSGVGFEYEPTGYARVAASAGDLTLSMASDFGLPRIGQIMSHNDWPFIVTSVIDDGTSGPEQRCTIGLQMPLREAIAVDDVISLRGMGRFEASDPGMGVAGYDANQTATVQLSFQEVLTR